MKSCNCAPDSKYKHLLSPINVGGLWLRNRMMTTSMSPGLGYTDCVTHMPTQTLGFKENRELYEQVKDLAPQVFIVGDCNEPKRMADATKAGYRAAASIK